MRFTLLDFDDFGFLDFFLDDLGLCDFFFDDGFALPDFLCRLEEEAFLLVFDLLGLRFLSWTMVLEGTRDPLLMRVHSTTTHTFDFVFDDSFPSVIFNEVTI